MSCRHKNETADYTGGAVAVNRQLSANAVTVFISSSFISSSVMSDGVLGHAIIYRSFQYHPFRSAALPQQITMKSIEAFARKGEKNMLRNMFKEEGASSDDSMSEEEGDEKSARDLSQEVDQLRNIVAAEGLSDDESDECGDNRSFPESIDNLPEQTTDPSDSGTSIEIYDSITGLFKIQLLQQKRKGIAHQLWPAATFLSKYIEANVTTLFPRSKPEDTGILELGAGIGLCGLVCSALSFKKTILTDLPVALDLLNSNIALNPFGIKSDCNKGEFGSNFVFQSLLPASRTIFFTEIVCRSILFCTRL